MTIISAELPYQIGALYSRKDEIHGRFGGQRQGGISTPTTSPLVIIFTGEAGKQHGYHDFWDDNGHFHYFGEGQVGDMQNKGGNRAISEHLANNKRLILFQMMGHGRPYRFVGEFRCIRTYSKAGIPDTRSTPRTAIVFELEPISVEPDRFGMAPTNDPIIELGSTSIQRLTEVRTKQTLFRRRLLSHEKQCRITKIEDLRFLRASHIKPWSACATGNERVDGANGLLLSPHADFLFDRGWITFNDTGHVQCSTHLPDEIINRIGLNLSSRKSTGGFSDQQRAYLTFHQHEIFDKAFKKIEDPIVELLATTPPA